MKNSHFYISTGKCTSACYRAFYQRGWCILQTQLTIVNASSLSKMIYINETRKKDFEKTIIYNEMKFGKKNYIITYLSPNVPSYIQVLLLVFSWKVNFFLFKNSRMVLKEHYNATFWIGSLVEVADCHGGNNSQYFNNKRQGRLPLMCLLISTQ